MTKKGVLLNTKLEYPIMFIPANDGLLINPLLFLDMIETDFDKYIATLRDPQNTVERENFEKYWNETSGHLSPL
jgi:hypothetical protein